MLPSTSDIRVFVQWSEQAVFAGEDIECQITFKNVAAITNAQRSLPQSISLNGFMPGGERQRRSTPLQSSSVQAKNNTTQNTRPAPPSRGHQSTLSLTVPAGDGRLQRGSGSKNSGQNETRTEERSHRRSVSIISLGINESSEDAIASQHRIREGSRNPHRGHVRASSLQIVPRRSGTNGGGPLSAPFSHRATTQPSPLFRTFSTSENEVLPAGLPLPERSSGSLQESSAGTAPSNQGIRKAPPTTRKDSASFSQSFKFPEAAAPLTDQRFPDYVAREDENFSPHASQASSRLSPRPREDTSAGKEQTSSMTRILSPASNGETPRSSGEFYSLSNNSTETLASEYLPQHQGRIQQHGTHTRRLSNIASVNQHRPPETLMMGYAQIYGSFTLDGSLINQAPFEEVKRRGVLGGQGGGVIGVETSKRDSGLLRGLGWGNIGESLGGLLSGGELSTIKDMRGIASSKSVPLLSTPQSILFVDLRLAPGESRSYKYSFKLPRGLPPSHRGKAIKVSYNLVIGTQRPGGAKGQQVKFVEVPFRILGSVNDHGELLGHDLMSPYIILRDQACVQSMESSTPNSAMSSQQSPAATKTVDQPQSTIEDFLAYVDELLTRPRQNSSLGLLSPTETRSSRRPSLIEEPSSAKEAIDLAILRSNLATGSQQSANRFEISRNRRRVAVVMLVRPAYRLGETITAAIEFTGADIPCYALHASLESTERVDCAISLRSEASIHRVTRKIYSSHSESTLFARRVVFSPSIPSTATPSFITSGVSLEWKILIEFVTPRFEDLEEGNMKHDAHLLEEISRDGRGVILAAAESIDCESFEIAVPLRIYGALIRPTEKDDEPVGLVV